MKKQFIWYCLFFVLFSCKFKIQDKVVPEWDAEILGPLVTADLTAQDLADINPLHAQKQISLSDISVLAGTPLASGIPIVIPAMGPINLGPFQLDFSDAFGQAEFISGEIYFVIRNEIEVDVKTGTRIIIKDGGSNILQDTLKQDLKAYNGIYTSKTINLANTTLNSSLNLYLENLKTNGTGSSKVVIDPKRRLIIDIYIKNVKFRKITVTTNNIFSIADTSQFSLEGGVIKSESVKGLVNTYVSSSFPVTLKLQIYFMDQSNTIKLDSLFDTPAIILPMTNNKVVESKFVTTLDDNMTENLNKARFVRSFVKASTGTNVVVYDTTSIKVKMVGDLKVKADE